MTPINNSSVVVSSFAALSSVDYPKPFVNNSASVCHQAVWEALRVFNASGRSSRIRNQALVQVERFYLNYMHPLAAY